MPGSTYSVFSQFKHKICPRNHSPRCRTHHRAKQAPDWTVEQTGPGVTRWTLPSGRTHVTALTKYDL